MTCLLDVGAFLGPNMKTQKVSEVEHHSGSFSPGFSSVPVLILEKHAGKTLHLITQQTVYWEVMYHNRYVTFTSRAGQETYIGETENN